MKAVLEFDLDNEDRSTYNRMMMSDACFVMLQKIYKELRLLPTKDQYLTDILTKLGPEIEFILNRN